MRRLALTVLAVAMFLGPAGAAFALLPTEPVITLAGDQWIAAGNADYIAYDSNSPTTPNRWHAYAMDRATLDVTKLDPPGYDSFIGDFDPGTNSVIYQQVDSSYSESDIYMYDLDTGTRTRVSGVSTLNWEWSPRISATTYLFIRNSYAGGEGKHIVYLRDRVSGEMMSIGSYPISVSMEATAVGDAYATWFVCRPATCKVYVYDMAAETTVVVPAPNGVPQYGSTLDEAAGELYFVRSGFRCGQRVGIWKVPLADLSATAVRLAAMPDGVDADYLSVAPNPDTLENDLLFSRYRCSGRGSVDIWRANGVSA